MNTMRLIWDSCTPTALQKPCTPKPRFKPLITTHESQACVEPIKCWISKCQNAISMLPMYSKQVENSYITWATWAQQRPEAVTTVTWGSARISSSEVNDLEFNSDFAIHLKLHFDTNQGSDTRYQGLAFTIFSSCTGLPWIPERSISMHDKQESSSTQLVLHSDSRIWAVTNVLLLATLVQEASRRQTEETVFI